MEKKAIVIIVADHLSVSKNFRLQISSTLSPMRNKRSSLKDSMRSKLKNPKNSALMAYPFLVINL